MTSSLLPTNSSAAERALEAALASDLDPSVLATLWNPQSCPAALLPWLAWALSADEWDEEWSEETQRSYLAAQVDIHRHKGTVASIRTVFARIGFGDVILDEGRSDYRYDGSRTHDGWMLHGDPSGWAWYQARLSKLLTLRQAAITRALLAAIAPVRCHLSGLDFTGAALIHNAVARYDGTYAHGVA